MKRRSGLLLCGLFFLVALHSCFWDNHDTSISISDSADEYRMTALYEENKTRKIRRFLKNCFEEHNNTSFKNRHVDETITLEDRTTFYINSYPGQLKIKLNKRENSEEAYYRMKDICEDIKDMLDEN